MGDKGFAAAYQRLAQVSNQTMGGSGGKFNPDIFRTFRPRKDVSTKIRLIPGEYGPGKVAIYSYVEHDIWKGNKGVSMPCTAGVGQDASTVKPCVACYYQGQGDASIKKSVKQAMTVVVLAPFHEIEQPSQKDSKRTVKFTRQCEGRGCEHCDKKVPKVFGDVRWWSLGKNHFGNVISAAKIVGKACTCGGTISRVGFECGKCGEMLMNVETSKLTDEAIEKYAVDDSVGCMACKFKDVPKEILECDKCQDPTRRSIFDANLFVMKQGEGTGSHLVVEDWEDAPLPKEFKGKVEPFKFDEMLVAPPPEIAAERLGLPNPFGAVAAGAAARATVPYDQAGGADPGEVNYGDAREE